MVIDVTYWFQFAIIKSIPDIRRYLILSVDSRSVPDDEGAWRNLWAGYCAFYETKVPEAVTAAAWARMLTPGSLLFGRLAELKGEVASFTISVLHASTWTLARICYL